MDHCWNLVLFLGVSAAAPRFGQQVEVVTAVCVEVLVGEMMNEVVTVVSVNEQLLLLRVVLMVAVVAVVAVPKKEVEVEVEVVAVVDV